MRPEAIALSNQLLQHHRNVCIIGNEPHSRCVIAYGELCSDAGVSHILLSVGQYLREVAEWCAENNMPPLNSLAVNGTTRVPGDKYDAAPGCSLLNWPDEIQRCIAFRNYPEIYSVRVA